MVILSGKICDDCLMLLASGEHTSTEHTNAFNDGVKAWNATPVPMDQESHFSWTPCDICESELGGNRTGVVFLKKA